MGIRRLTRLLGDTSDLELMMRSVIQEIGMGKQIQPIKYPATQVAACLVRSRIPDGL